MLTNPQEIFDVAKQFFPDTITGQSVNGALIIYLMNPRIELVALMAFGNAIRTEPQNILLDNGNLVIRLPPEIPFTIQTLMKLCPEHLQEWDQRNEN